MLHSHEHIIIYSVQVQHQVVRDYGTTELESSRSRDLGARHFLQVNASFGGWGSV